jgi:glycosyltransferase involved in cell wall biosynthesis
MRPTGHDPQRRLKVLMATSKLYPPQFYGGAEMSTHAMSLLLQQAGCEVAVLAGLAPRGLLTRCNRLASRLRPGEQYPFDRRLGYPCFRGWDPLGAVDELCRRFAPDVVFAQSGRVVSLAEAFAERGVPSFIFLRHTHVHYLGANPRPHALWRYVANSKHTAEFYRREFGIESEILTPSVIPELYRTETDRSRVVYVNPNPMKGIDRVLDLAERRPDIPFDIVESWKQPAWMTAEAESRAARLANVRWLPPTEDMRRVYRQARLLLAPSGVGHPEWIEAWGRVATEAQVSGIPVLASNSGGLPEAVGPGGVVLDVAAPLGDWLAALARLWDDEACYARLAAAALQHAARPEIMPLAQVEALLARVRASVGGAMAEAAPA